jgi:long-chain fatty acid transport protein
MRASLAKSPRPAVLVLTLAVISAVIPCRLGADDFTFHEPSARAAALGGAFTARADDATALFYNPAGLAFLGGFRLKTNIAFDRRTTSAVRLDTGRTFETAPSEITGSLGVSWQPLKRVTIGTGFFSPFNYESYWTPGWSGETLCTRDRLRSFFFRTVLAVEVVKGLAVSGGLDVVSSSLRWRHLIPFNLEPFPLAHDVDVESSHVLHGSGLGFVAGALWKVFPALQIGARYQKSVAIDYAGTDIFNRQLDISGESVPNPTGGTRRVSDLIDLYYRTQNVTGHLTLPREIALGAAFTPIAKLSLYFDVQLDRWQGSGDWIFRSENEGDAINPAFTSVYQQFYGLALDYGVQGVALGLQDTKKFKAGLEFRPGRYLALRAGYARHQSSVDEADRTPVYPDLDRSVYSLGFGYEGPLFSIWGDGERVSDLSFDVFVRYASAAPGPSTLPGFEMTYDSNRFVFGIGAGFIF